MRPVAVTFARLRRGAGAWRSAWVAAVVLAAGPVGAQTVNLVGLSAGKALLVIDGAAPRFLGAGDAASGVRVITVNTDAAVVDIHGERRTLHLGEQPLTAAAPPASQARRIVLVADGAGHFTGQAQVNGRMLPFLLDTGATLTVLSESQARQIGLTTSTGRVVRVKTANGEGMGRAVMLDTVHVGDATTYNVDALVIPSSLPYMLLGNSFLARFGMRRENDRMILEQRY